MPRQVEVQVPEQVKLLLLIVVVIIIFAFQLDYLLKLVKFHNLYKKLCQKLI